MEKNTDLKDYEYEDLKGYEGIYKINKLGEIRNKNYMILIHQKSREGYLSVDLNKNGKRTNIRLHKLLAIQYIPNPLNKTIVIHKNGNINDNRVENLEWLNNEKQLINKKTLNSKNTTGYRGVTFDKQHQKFKSRIQINGNTIHLGLYTTAEEAYEARKKYEIENLAHF